MKPLLTSPLLLALAGCSLFAGSTQTVAITCNEPRAELYVDGQHVGTGNATLPLRRNRDHVVMAKLGDRANISSIGTTISTTGVLDIIGGVLFLVPLVGIVGPGFWSLDPTTVAINVPPEGK